MDKKIVFFFEFLFECVGLIVTLVILTILLLSIFPVGFMTNEPNNARVMIFFGKYRGTLKDNGFFWMNPFYVKKRITLRGGALRRRSGASCGQYWNAASMKMRTYTGDIFHGEVIHISVIC